jgi:hypothetical protein
MAHHPDGRTSAVSNFLIRLSSVRTMGDERPDGYSSTRNFHIGNAHVWTMIGSRPDGWSRIDNFLLWCTRVRMGYHIVRTIDWSSLSWNLERNQKLIEYWEASERDAETSGQMQAGTETSRYSMGSRQNEHFVRTDDAGLSSIRTDGKVDRWASRRLAGILNSSDF